MDRVGGGARRAGWVRGLPGLHQTRPWDVCSLTLLGFVTSCLSSDPLLFPSLPSRVSWLLLSPLLLQGAGPVVPLLLRVVPPAVLRLERPHPAPRKDQWLCLGPAPLSCKPL